MHTKILFNGRIAAAPEARLTAVSSAALYGKGVFTTVAIRDGKPFLWEKHLSRLKRDASVVGIDISYHADGSIRKALDRIITENGVSVGRARITLFEDSPGTIWSYQSENKTALLITTADRRSVSRVFRLTFSPFRINSASPLAGVKSCNYLEKTLAIDEAKRRAFDEAVQLNERGEITSACMANLFWLKDGVLYTPPAETGCLAGTTREFVMENLDCVEVVADAGKLKAADSIFLTSAGMGVTAVSEFEGKKLETPLHPILSLLPPDIFRHEKNTNPSR